MQLHHIHKYSLDTQEDRQAFGEMVEWLMDIFNSLQACDTLSEVTTLNLHVEEQFDRFERRHINPVFLIDEYMEFSNDRVKEIRQSIRVTNCLLADLGFKNLSHR